MEKYNFTERLVSWCSLSVTKYFTHSEANISQKPSCSAVSVEICGIVNFGIF